MGFAPAKVEMAPTRGRVLFADVARQSPPAPAPDVGFVADFFNHRWEYDKGPERMVEAFVGLKERGVAYRAVLCGEVWLRSGLTTAAALR